MDLCPFSGSNMNRNSGTSIDKRPKREHTNGTYTTVHNTYIPEHTTTITNQPISTPFKSSGCVTFTKHKHDWKAELYETNEQKKPQIKVFEMERYAGGLQEELLRKENEIKKLKENVEYLESRVFEMDRNTGGLQKEDFRKDKEIKDLESQVSKLVARNKVLEGYKRQWETDIKLDKSAVKQPPSFEQKSSGKSNTLYKNTITNDLQLNRGKQPIPAIINGNEENRESGRLAECDNHIHAKYSSRQVQSVSDDKRRCNSSAFDENVQRQLIESEQTVRDLQKVIKDLEFQIQRLQEEKTFLQKTNIEHKQSNTSVATKSANFTGRHTQKDKGTSTDFLQNQHNIPKSSDDYLDQSVSACKNQKNVSSEECERNIQHQLKEKEQKTIDLQNEIHNLQQRIRNLELTNARLEKKNAELKQMSDKITQRMADKLDSGGCFESVNDSFANSKIAQKLKSLYDGDWVKLFIFLRKAFPKMHELERIKKLSYLIQCCNRECVKLADKQIRMLLLLDETGRLPVQDEQIREMLTHRKRLSQMDFVRNSVTKNVLEIILSTDEAKQLFCQESGEQMKKELKSFFAKLIDGCWLVAISFPAMILNFGVVGQQFKDCEERWTEFSTKKPVEDTSVIEGTIIEVVWPSVELRDGTACYTKGDAVVVKKGKNK